MITTLHDKANQPNPSQNVLHTQINFLRDLVWCDILFVLYVAWTVGSPPPEIPTIPTPTPYVPGPEQESEADRLTRIKAWVCKPDKPSTPGLRAAWFADLLIWRNGGNTPLPPQLSTLTPSTSSKPENIIPSSPDIPILNPEPPSPPAIPVDHNCSPPKAPKNFIHKTDNNKNKYKKPKLQKSFQNKKFFSNQSSPFVVPDSPVDVKPDRKSTVEDLIETPPPSPLPTSNEHSFSTSTNTEDTTPDLSTSTSTDQPITESYPSITREGIDAFIREYGPGSEIIALTETIFNLFSTHWKLFPSNDPAELNARSNLVTAMKNVVALDVVYRAHPRPDLRPPHYDGITTGLPPHIIPSAAHASFYDDVAKDNFKFSAEEKGKKRARE
ncbi:hypothetical protein DFH28DRAFT_1173977 [Melampsora americana]|nr:hypothetical protein DFH28DRAFT_1173977 [Melampsora americana]